MGTPSEVGIGGKRYPSITAAAAALGIPRTTLRDQLAKSVDREAVPPAPQVGLPAEGFIVKKNSVGYDAEGEVKAQWIQMTAAPGDKHIVLPGHRVKGESVLVDAEGRTIQKWVKTREGAIGEGLVEALEVAFGKFTGAAPLVHPPAWSLAELHTVYPLADLHLGMYSWGRETGEAYDMGIAVERARGAYRSLVAVTPPSKTATLLNLGDYLHTNDQKNVTPASGHQLDVDGRFPRVLEAAIELKLEIIDLLLQRHELVEVVSLPGNHDPEAAVAIRVALNLYYRKHARVEVCMSPGIMWFRRFGKVLLAGTHGHTIKQSEIPGMMACDRSVDWGLTDFRYCFTGHIHHERAVEKHGVKVESLQTLASRDAYATNGGWRSGHSAKSITFHQDDGEISRSTKGILARAHRPNPLLAKGTS